TAPKTVVFETAAEETGQQRSLAESVVYLPVSKSRDHYVHVPRLIRRIGALSYSEVFETFTMSASVSRAPAAAQLLSVLYHGSFSERSFRLSACLSHCSFALITSAHATTL